MTKNIKTLQLFFKKNKIFFNCDFPAGFSMQIFQLIYDKIILLLEYNYENSFKWCDNNARRFGY